MILREMLIKLGFDFNRKGVDDANAAMASFKRAGETVLKAFAFQKVFQGVTGMLDQAAGAMDRVNVLNKTFGAHAQEVVAFTELQADALGRSKYSLQEYAASFGSLLVPAMKGNTAKAAEMSTSLAKLSVDLGSFFHMADDEVLWRLRSGMLGSTIAVDNLGIELHDAALKVFAAEQGFKGYSKSMDPAMKMQLRFMKIMHDTANAKDFAAQTAGEYDNRLRKLKEAFKTLTIDIGMQLIPAGTRVVEMLGNWAEKLGGVVKGSNLVGAAIAMLSGLFGLLALQWTLANIPLLVTIAFLALLTLAIDDLYTGLEGGDSYIKDWFENLAGKDAWMDVIRTWREGKQILDEIMAGNWGAVANRIYDFANPNKAFEDATAMERANRALKWHEMRNGTNETVRRNAWALNPNVSMADLSGPAPRFGPSRGNGVGPITGLGAYNAGAISITINGNASPSTVREIERVARQAQERQQRDLYKTTGRFNVATAGTGGVAGAEGPEL